MADEVPWIVVKVRSPWKVLLIVCRPWRVLGRTHGVAMVALRMVPVSLGVDCWAIVMSG